MTQHLLLKATAKAVYSFYSTTAVAFLNIFSSYMDNKLTH